MILVPGIDKRKVAVFGLGATGLSACASLAASGAEVFCWDENADARVKTDNTAWAAVHPKEWPWAELLFVVLSPGVPLTHPKPHVIVRKAKQEKVEILGDIELFARALDALDPKVRPRVIAVTGSNGKSTTTALIGHILREADRRVAVGGNIGEPVLRLDPPAEGLIYVLELSSYQLELTDRFHADTAVLLNITPDHLDRHGSLANYVAAKRRIFRNSGAGDRAVVGVDDDLTQSICATLAARTPVSVAPVSALGALGQGVFALGGRLFYRLDGKTGEAGDIAAAPALKGVHNAQNAGAALAAVLFEGVSPTAAVRSMMRFKGLKHRMEPVARIGAVQFVNDSKATNADAAANALKAYDNIYWIAGGRAKTDGVASLRPLMTRVRGAYLIGESAQRLEGELAGAAPVFQCGDLKSAVRRAARDAAESGSAACVLLSPACASQDQFRNFEDRGDQFRSLVEAYRAEQDEGAAA